MFTRINGDTSIYRTEKNDNLGSINDNLFFTFDNIFGIVSKYLQYKTEKFLGRKLINMEYPDRDSTQQMLQSSDKQLAAKTEMPRAILMYEINPSDEDLVEIPALKTHFDINNGLQAELECIRRSKLDQSILKELNMYRDIDITLYGYMAYSSAILHYTVLLDNRVSAIDLQKLFKYAFPLNNLHDIYRSINRTDDTTGKTNNKDIPTMEEELIPFTIKTIIPNEIIDRLKNVFEIEDYEDSDNLLEEIMRKYSFNDFTREIDGSKRTVSWTTKYDVIPILVPTSLERYDNVKNMKETSAVKMTFQLNYVEMRAYKLRTKYKVLSPDNENNMVENSYVPIGTHSFYTSAMSLNIAPEIDNCTLIFEDFKIAYDVEDFKNGEMKVKLDELIDSRDKYIGKYMRYLNDSLLEEDSKFYKIIIKHASGQSIDKDIYSSVGSYYSYDDMCIYDTKSQPGQEIYIIGYVDKVAFTKWKYKMGFIEDDNLSAKFVKR